jgi:DNA polymerase-1
MADPKVVKIFHNAKFDIKMLRSVGVKIRGRYHDTMVLGHLLSAQGPAGPEYDENCLKRLKLEVLARKYIPDMPKLELPGKWIERNAEELLATHGESPTYEGISVADYAIRDVEVTIRLFYLFYPNMKKLNLGHIYKTEMELMDYVIEMEDRGVVLDIPYMKQRVEELTKAAVESEAKLRGWLKPIVQWKNKTRQRKGVKRKVKYKLVLQPEEVNLNSDKQLAAVIFGQLKQVPTARTPKGAPKMDERSLSRINHPFCKELIRHRQYVKVRDTYFVGYMDRMIDGILHPNYAQQGANSGRFSSSDPNLQNIPMEEQVRERADADVIFKGVKNAFIPRKGYQNWHFDYKQIELVMFAHESGDRRVMDVMTSGRDLHNETCEALYGYVEEKKRVLAKIVNFGILYGMGRKTFAWKLKCSPEKVEELLELYYQNFPGVRDFQQRVISQVRSLGYLRNWAGRRYHIDPRFAYKGVNYLCQGGAADVLKRAMARVGRFLKGLKSNMIMTIHDEIVVEVHDSEKHFVPKAIVKIMTQNPELRLPLRVSAEKADPNFGNLVKVSNKELGLEAA